MKKQSDYILTAIVIIISIIVMLYFGYEIIWPILGFINTDIMIADNISVIMDFFQIN
jgi:uncharacterized membrane protein